MKKIEILALVLGTAFTVFTMVPGASGLTITPDTLQTYFDPGAYSTLYLAEFGGGEEGSYASSYTTNWVLDSESEPTGATIHYDTGAYITGSVLYFEVKDGEGHVPSAYYYDLTALGWDGQSDIVLTGFWNGVPGAISNVRIVGTAVPEPGTLLLLGAGLLGVATVRRKLIKR